MSKLLPILNPSFGNWLKRRRLYLGYTRQEFAELMNYSTDLVKKIEIGTRRPVEIFIVRCIKLLQIPSELEQSFIVFARTNAWTANLESLAINAVEDDGFSVLARFSVRHGQLLSMVIVEGNKVMHKIVRVQVEQSNCILRLNKDTQYMLIKSRGVTGPELTPEPSA